jgi:acetate kinase
MNILLLNAGSSSLNGTLLMESADSGVVAGGQGDWAGSVTRYQYAIPGGTERSEEARLSRGIYTHRVRQAPGALAVTMAGVDALVFTAGVGEHAREIRASICAGLECLGLELDAQANASCLPDADVARPGSRGRILVIGSREHVTMLREVIQVLG